MAARMSQRAVQPVPLVVLVVAIAVAYMWLAILGRQASISDAGVSLFWPPTAFGIAVVARTTGKTLGAGVLGLVLGVVCVDIFYFQFDPKLAVLFAVVNVSEQFLIGTALKRFSAQRLMSLRDLAVLLSAAVLVIAVTSMIGGFLAVAQFGGAYPAAWRTWFAGDLSAAIIAAPFFLTVRMPRRFRWGGVAVAVPVVVLMLAAVVWEIPSPYLTVLLAVILVAPTLVWLGLRFGLTEVAGVATLVTYLAAVAPTASGGLLSPISGEVLLILSTQLVIIMFCLLIYSASIVEQARKLAANAEAHAHDQLATMFSSSPIPICRVASDNGVPGTIELANSAFADMIDRSLEDLQGSPIIGLFGSPEIDEFLTGGEFALPGGSAQQLVAHRLRFVRDDGRVVWLRLTVTPSTSPDSASPDFFVIFAEDETHRHELELEQTYQATHDALTGLLNRYALVAAIDERLARRTGDTKLCAFLCDLDQFKEINDSLGHTAGDVVLRAVAERFMTLSDRCEVISRFGGDEFVLLCANVSDEQDALWVAQKIRDSLLTAVDVNGTDEFIQVSIGIALVDSSIHSGTELLSRADLAMYAAKSAGRNRAEVYQSAMQERLQHHIDINAKLRAAIDEDRIVCWYQPVVDPKSVTAVGAEALVRLQDRDGSILMPSDFIGIAETGGPILELGDRVLDLALQWLAGHDVAASPFRISVNVSVKQLDDPEFFDRVIELLRRHNVAPDLLIVEVTERVIIEAEDLANETLGHLRAAGVHVAIDDFGTGSSSLNALRWMPADIVKIDRSFTMNMLKNPDDYAIVAAVIEVSHALGRTVVGEGVETREQAEAMLNLGCDLLQGYYFAKPMPSESYGDVALTDTQLGLVQPDSR